MGAVTVAPLPTSSPRRGRSGKARPRALLHLRNSGLDTVGSSWEEACTSLLCLAPAPAQLGASHSTESSFIPPHVTEHVPARLQKFPLMHTGYHTLPYSCNNLIKLGFRLFIPPDLHIELKNIGSVVCRNQVINCTVPDVRCFTERVKAGQGHLPWNFAIRDKILERNLV